MPDTRRAIALSALLVFTPVALAAPWRVLDATPAPGIAAHSLRALAPAIVRATGTEPAFVPREDGAAVAADVAAGKADLGAFALRLLEADEPALGMARVPFLATSFVDASKLWQVLRPRVEQALAARGMTLLYAVPSPPLAPLSRVALTSMAAWRGVKLLLPEPGLGALARVLGTQPVSGASPRAELGASRAQAVFAAADSAARDKAWEYAGHYLHAPAWFPLHVVAVNRGALMALDGARRDALLSAADAAEASAWTQAQRGTEDAVQMLRDYGIKTAQTPVNLLIQLEALGRELLFHWSEGAGEAGAELVEAYYAIR